MFKSTPDDTHTLRQSSELLRFRKGAARRSKVLSMTVLVLASLLVGVWMHADWAMISARATTALNKADSYIHNFL
ncbi:MAG: hypothetical protein ABSG66_03775 [Stellaceae bacterium]|jgi:hypothetical protein